MARRHPILRGFAILVGVVLAMMIALVIVTLLGGGEALERMALRDAVGVVDLRGVIEDATEAIETLDRFRTQDSIVGVVVRIDSPGGAVAPSQETYDAVWRLRGTKPVIASLGNVAASGGYYIASAADVIVAAPGTITGSIGALMAIHYVAPLAEKLGVSEEIVKSGRFKDTGHPFRPLDPEERQLLQGMVDDVLGQFVSAVARGRGMEPERVRALADGRIFSGAQAKEVGLVDQLGGLTEATRIAWERAGQTGEPHLWRVRTHRRRWWVDLLGSIVGVPTSVPFSAPGGLLLLYHGALPR
jgi:protease-4